MNAKQSKTISLEDVLELYKQALEETTLVVITDVAGRITYANDAFCALTGYSAEELLSQQHQVLKAGAPSRLFNQQLWKTIRRGNIWRGTLTNDKKDGAPLHLKASIYPFPAAPREPFQFLTVALEAPSLQDDNQPNIPARSQTNGHQPEEPDMNMSTGQNGWGAVSGNGQPKDQAIQEDALQDNKKLKVMVATDAAVNRLVISKYLEKLNISFDAAHDGLSVLNKLQQTSYDLILIDMKMPLVDGPNTIKAIRRKKESGLHTIPIIALSTSPQEDALNKCLAAGADDCLAEPFKMEELNQKIRKLVIEKRNPQHMDTPQNNASSAHQQPLYNLEYLEQLSEGDQEFTTSMIQYFIDNAPAVLDSMKESYEQKDWVALRNVAHKFKPQLNFMGINSVLEEVESIEQDAFKQQNLERLPSLIQKTDRICREAIEQLKQKL